MWVLGFELRLSCTVLTEPSFKFTENFYIWYRNVYLGGAVETGVWLRAFSALTEGLSLVSRWLTPPIIQVLGD